MIGETLDGKYAIVAEIGGGGMGTVYEARHAGTGRRVAVKLITGELTKNGVFVSRFHREARAAGAIESQHIVQVLDTGVDPVTTLPFMVMEYLDGEDLSSLFRRLGPVRPDLALRIAAQACIGLQKAHEAHVVHRDIKPGNLFLAKRDDGDYILKLLDFGIAKITADQVGQVDAGGLTRTGSMLGSPLYMAPEQARGQKTIDHRADLWSLGVVLYQALTGRRPHEDIDALGDLIIAICSELPRPVQEVAPWVPSAVAAIPQRALRFDPNDRYQSAAEMLEAIRPLLPGGWSINGAMLVGVTPEERAQLAPRGEAEDASSQAATIVVAADRSAHGNDPTIAEQVVRRPVTPAPATRSAPPIPMQQASLQAAHQQAAHQQAAHQQQAAQQHAAMQQQAALQQQHAAMQHGASVRPPGAMEQGQAPLRGPESAKRPAQSMAGVAIGALVVVGLGLAAGAYALRGGPDAPVPSATLPALPAPSQAPLRPSADVAPPRPSPSTRTVKVDIAPVDAAVEVDGAKVQLTGGVLEITGTLGSVHRVRLSQGGRELTRDVVISDSGPIPTRVELDRGKP